jgi:hypothetical protein
MSQSSPSPTSDATRVCSARTVVSCVALICLAACASTDVTGNAGPSSRNYSNTATGVSVDRAPDLSGVWTLGRVVDWEVPDMVPSAAAIFKDRVATNYKDRPSTYCLPSGILRFTDPFKVIQTQSLLVILLEDDIPAARQIFLDGRGHPPHLEPSWKGHSVGRWDNNTLIVDRTGFTSRAWIDAAGHPASEHLQVTERYHRLDRFHLEINMRFDDPTVYRKPWSVTRVWDLATDDDIIEFVCTENNRDPSHMVGQ